MESSLYKEADEQYDRYELGKLPESLQRNSLDHYYLSVYPPLKGMQAMDEGQVALPEYPETISNAYVHIPFCSGVCDFCSYFVTAVRPDKIERVENYLDLVKREIDYHRARTNLQINYLYMGGGTPSLIPPAALKNFLDHLAGNSVLAPEVQGTLELHPEFFRQREHAQQFLDALKEHGINRVSLGLESASDEVLACSNRRHEADFFRGAVDFIKNNGFYLNVDLMYGLPDMTFEQWEHTLKSAVACNPDSISTYFLFVDPGTRTWHDVKRGKIILPDNRTIQTQHLMGRNFLQQNGFHELPNDFYSKVQGDPEQFIQEALPSAGSSLPIGAGAYGFLDGTQFYNQFDLQAYEARIKAGLSPVWRGHKLDADNQLRRDIMFSFKNSPSLNKKLFEARYGTDPARRFPEIFRVLTMHGLIEDTDSTIKLTPKGNLCVEEVCSLFGDADLLLKGAPGRSPSEQAKLEKHNYSPTLRRLPVVGEGE